MSPRDIPGARELQAISLGDPAVRVAVIDGPVDLTHPALAGASLAVPAHLTPACLPGPACWHGTAIASLIFGQPGTAVEGLAPGCAGLILPVLRNLQVTGSRAEVAGCSQLELAAAIDLAVAWDASIINVSAGQVELSGSPDPMLRRSVSRAIERGILLIAAAGNDSDSRVRVPAALEGVLVVGAHDREGRALPGNNDIRPHASRALLAPGLGLLAARGGGGTTVISGTSAATAVVAGLAALASSAGRALERPFTTSALRRKLLDARVPISEDLETSHSPAPGRVDFLSLAVNIREPRATDMSEAEATADSQASVRGPRVAGATSAAASNVVAAAGCGCAECAAKAATASSGSAPGQLVFALGQLGHDLQSEARRDSIAQHMNGPAKAGQRLKDPFDASHMLDYLKSSFWEAASVLWTLNSDQTPIYVVMPSGPFANVMYEELRAAYREQVEGKIERVSVPGRLVGEARLYSGQVVPVIQPERRGFYSWSTSELVAAVSKEPPAKSSPPDKATSAAEKADGVRRFLDRVYHELRNLGLTPRDRAINYAATNAFLLEEVYERSLKEAMDLDEIHVERSTICRPGSDCWDVVLAFFYPGRPQPAVRRLYRFTVDVSDVVPVLVGPVRDWFTR